MPIHVLNKYRCVYPANTVHLFTHAYLLVCMPGGRLDKGKVVKTQFDYLSVLLALAIIALEQCTIQHGQSVSIAV